MKNGAAARQSGIEPATSCKWQARCSVPAQLRAASLGELRRQLPDTIRLWAGGAGVAALPRLPAGVVQIPDMFTLRSCWLSLPARKPSSPE